MKLIKRTRDLKQLFGEVIHSLPKYLLKAKDYAIENTHIQYNPKTGEVLVVFKPKK